MSAIAVFKEPSRTIRVLSFAFFTLPGAVLAAAASAWIGAAIAYNEDPWIISLALIPAILGARLVAHGTRIGDKPLYLLVLLPMPILMSLGYHLGSAGVDHGFLIGFGGIMLPTIGCPLVNRYYAQRAAKAAASTVVPISPVISPDTAAYPSWSKPEAADA
jgi:hypothetical protein